MARLEWAHTEAFDNEAKPPLKTNDSVGLDAAKIRLQLQPHLTLLKLRNEIDDFLIELKKIPVCAVKPATQWNKIVAIKRRGPRTV
jgi:hypothetical protein